MSINTMLGYWTVWNIEDLDWWAPAGRNQPNFRWPLITCGIREAEAPPFRSRPSGHMLISWGERSAEHPVCDHWRLIIRNGFRINRIYLPDTRVSHANANTATARTILRVYLLPLCIHIYISYTHIRRIEQYIQGTRRVKIQCPRTRISHLPSISLRVAVSAITPLYWTLRLFDLSIR